jgi:hypothetical protein
VGDAGAVLDLAAECRLVVGPVSSKRWGEGGRKNGEDKQPDLVAPRGRALLAARSLRKIATDGPRYFARE